MRTEAIPMRISPSFQRRAPGRRERRPYQNMCYNIYSKPTAASKEEFLTLLETPNVRIEQIVSNGQASPEGFWFDQSQNEWVVLLKGSATLRFEDGRTLELLGGDSLSIPARTRHRVDSVSADAIWLAVFY